MGLIDKEATLKAIADYLRADLADCNHYYLQGAQDVAEVVENMPEVKSKSKKALWIPKNCLGYAGWFCSACGYLITWSDDDKTHELPNKCPNCKAEMEVL